MSVGKTGFSDFATSLVADGMPLTIDLRGCFFVPPGPERLAQRSLKRSPPPGLVAPVRCRCLDLLTGLVLTFRLGGLAIRLVLGQQELAQGLQIPPQDAQGYITLVTGLAAIATTL